MIIVIHTTYEGEAEAFGPFETVDAARKWANEQAQEHLQQDEAIVQIYGPFGGAAIRSTGPDETTYHDWIIDILRKGG